MRHDEFGGESEKDFRDNRAKMRFDKNAWKETFLDDNRIRKVSANLRLTYEADDGEMTETVVRVREVDRFLQKGIFHGFCEVRQKSVIFRYDQIYSCADLETGEAVSDVQQYLLLKYEESAEKTLDILFYKYIDVLKVLFFIGRTDDRFDEQQAVIVHEYLCIFTDDLRLTEEQIDALFLELPPPALLSCKKAINRADSYENVDLKDLLLCCQALVDTQKRPDAEKIRALEYLKKRTRIKLASAE